MHQLNLESIFYPAQPIIVDLRLYWREQRSSTMTNQQQILPVTLH